MPALPSPSGPYAVGTRLAHLTSTADLGHGILLLRPANIQVWFPAVRGSGRIRAPYLAEPALLDSMLAEKYLDTPAGQIRGWADVRLNAWLDARPAVAKRGRGWPTLVFAHGFGVARAQYSALVQELASHGYVVLLVDDPYGGFALTPDGKLMQPGGDSLRARMRSASLQASVDSALALRARFAAQDAARIVRHLAAALREPSQRPLIDTTHVGMLGHSLGGAAALEACRQSPLFRACADMDGDPVGDVARSGVGRPFLVLLSQPAPHNAPPRDSAEAARRLRFAAIGRERDSTWAAVAAHQHEMPAYILKLVGTAHFSFSDAPFTIPGQLEGVGVSLTPASQFEAMRLPLLDFFDHYLRGRPLRTLKQRP